MIVLLFGWAESFNFGRGGNWNKRKESRDGPFVVLNAISCLGALADTDGLEVAQAVGRRHINLPV